LVIHATKRAGEGPEDVVVRKKTLMSGGGKEGLVLPL